ncbi:MAG: lanthionine synthetase C family protein [Gaiellaceae bacterium]
MKNLYVGTAGVLWALDALRRHGHAETNLALPNLALRNLELFRARPDYMRVEEQPEQRASSLLCGEAGIALVAWRLAPDDALADDLLALVRANVASDADDVMWGTPGTLIAARTMLEWTGDERWRAASDGAADALWSRRRADGLWTQHLWGEAVEYLGPAHGLVGNAQAIRPLLDDERRSSLERETAAILERTAVVEDDLANWPTYESGQLTSSDGQIRLQWCWGGAPGIVASAADYLDEELILAGAELTWRAGPHRDEKGPGICHGTAGNGYAFLKAFERTGDELWLERARRFAVHALGQVARLRVERGRGRYSLWTGDPGVALYASNCLDGRSDYPFFDFDAVR